MSRIAPSRRPSQTLLKPAALALAALAAPALLSLAATRPAARAAETVAAPATNAYLFVSPDCPIAARYATRIAALARDYAGRGVRVTLVYSGGDAKFGDAQFARWAGERQLGNVARVRDADGALARRLHATTTPEAVITDAADAVRYIGRVDDNADTGLVTKSDARLALDAVLSGKPVANPRAKAFGCAIVLAEPHPRPLSSEERGEGNLSKSSFPPSPRRRGAGGEVPNYAHDVAPILNRNCVSCHRAGDAGPFALDSYAQAKQWAAAIKDYTTRRKMPPFKADPHYGGPFEDQRVLSDKQIQTIAAWSDAGAPAGDLRYAPKPTPKPTSSWTLGAPDAVLTPAAAYHLDADGADVYRDFTVSEPFTEDTYVKAMEFQPGNRAIVHHMIAFIDMTGATCTEKEGKSPDGPGWAVSGAGSGVKDWDWGAGWAPGMNAAKLPQGVALLIPKGARLVLQVHYHKSGKPETDFPHVALYKATADETITRHIKVATLGNPLLQIKPNVSDNLVTATMILPYDATLFQIMPHMHYLGKSMAVTATTPDGTVLPLVKINDWEFSWQMAYRYQNPIKLPKGTRLSLRATFDNTADNPYQPSEPPRDVHFGESTTDEMCFAFLGLTHDSPAGEGGAKGAGAVVGR